MIPVTQVCRALVRYATYCMPVCSVLHAADTAVVKVHDQVSGSAATLQAETLKIEGAIEVFAGISTGSPDSTTVVRHGFIGQLTDPASLQLSAPASEVAEEGTLTLSAKTLNTDSTHSTLDASVVTFGIVSGPVQSIGASGELRAGTVYADTAAEVSGGYAGLTGTLGLTVLNTNLDNFGTYAGDTLPDDWQVQWFGIDSPNAAPGLDPDGDGQDNLLEYLAGVTPTDAGDRFRVELEMLDGDLIDIRFHPTTPRRSYSIRKSHKLDGSDWTYVTPTSFGAIIDGWSSRYIQPTSSTEFYQVEIQVSDPLLPPP